MIIGFIYQCFRALSQWMRAVAAINLIVLTLLAGASVQATAVTQQTHLGLVTRVTDGDTLWVQTSAVRRPLKVRIQGIDAPEICQSGGVKARDALKRQTLGKSVTVNSSAHDDYGRTVGTVYVQGADIGRWMVVQGHAWVYTSRSKKSPYDNEFAQAQRARQGVFSAFAEEPRLFRKRHGLCHVRR